jgi:hypothetical protein
MRRELFFVMIATAAAACSSTLPPAAAPPPAARPAPVTPKETPAAALADHEGDSPETAVPVPAESPNEGIDFQNNWIFDRYGRFRRVKGGIAHAGEGSATRRYEVVTFEVPDHSEHTVYFDITENEKTWTPSAVPPQPH